jgi:hypothetical protein
MRRELRVLTELVSTTTSAMHSLVADPSLCKGWMYSCLSHSDSSGLYAYTSLPCSGQNTCCPVAWSELSSHAALATAAFLASAPGHTHFHAWPGHMVLSATRSASCCACHCWCDVCRWHSLPAECWVWNFLLAWLDKQYWKSYLWSGPSYRWRSDSAKGFCCTLALELDLLRLILGLAAATLWSKLVKRSSLV